MASRPRPAGPGVPSKVGCLVRAALLWSLQDVFAVGQGLRVLIIGLKRLSDRSSAYSGVSYPFGEIGIFQGVEALRPGRAGRAAKHLSGKNLLGSNR